ncbi:MAG: hypothetical protein IJA88_03205 [Clostridia bacterium]|nr:hypothetical protein [Clostridia bacterium]
MNEKLQYATMLEIPVSTCNVTFKPVKKRRGKRKKVDIDAVKDKLVDKVNTQMQSVETDNAQPQEQIAEQYAVSVDNNQNLQSQESQTEIAFEEQNGLEQAEEQTALVRPAQKKKFKFSIVGVQLAIIGALVAVIFLTNALYTDSGINVFLRNVFGTQSSVSVDTRDYDEFAPVISIDDGATVTLSDGVMTFSGKGSLYAPCNGKVTMLTLGEDGKYTMEITHSEKFKSVLTGIDYAYAGIDDTVYFNIPVGYVTAGATMCFTNSNGAVISDYQIIDDAVVWSV